MQDTTKWTSNRIETISCFAPRCKSSTTDWISDGWWVTGYNTRTSPRETPWQQQTGEDLTMPCESAVDTVHARRELENMGLITRSPWAVAYLCPSHAVEAKAAL